MNTLMHDDTNDTVTLIDRVRGGDRRALDELFARHRPRLLRMAEFRLDQRLRGRIDASDVVQETHLEAFRRFERYVAEPNPMPFFLWLRFLTGQKVLELQRRHLGAQRRDVRQEVRFAHAPRPGVSTHAIAEHLAGRQERPSQVAMEAEERRRLHDAIDAMDPIDREVLTLRHFEQLSNAETAAELGLEVSATSKRYTRALRKLAALLATETGERPGND
jgi:RNA polymerase sigma-70 factor (ECF subfamily)